MEPTELRPVWTCTAMKFLCRLHETGTTCLVPGFWTKNFFCVIKDIADPEAYRFEISGPGLRSVVIYTRTVRIQTGTTISRRGPATETKSDRSEFIVRPVSCKRKKRNV